VREALEREAEVPAAIYRVEERIRIVPDDQPRLRLLRGSPLSICAAASKDRNARFINFGPASSRFRFTSNLIGDALPLVLFPPRSLTSTATAIGDAR